MTTITLDSMLTALDNIKQEYHLEPWYPEFDAIRAALIERDDLKLALETRTAELHLFMDKLAEYARRAREIMNLWPEKERYLDKDGNILKPGPRL